MTIKCKKCGSLRLHKNGSKIVKNIKLQRYRCTKCNFQFTNKPGLAIFIKRSK